jgi:hypothetical protein
LGWRVIPRWPNCWRSTAACGIAKACRHGPIAEAPGETWLAVNHALRRGSRGLQGGASLAELLAVERDVRNRVNLPPLNRKVILRRAVSFHRRMGHWPTKSSKAVPEVPGDSWQMLEEALLHG